MTTKDHPHIKHDRTFAVRLDAEAMSHINWQGSVAPQLSDHTVGSGLCSVG